MSAFGRFLGRIFGAAPKPAPPPKPPNSPPPPPKPRPAPKPGTVTIVYDRRATYDSADESDEYNRKHWLSADELSANTANSPEVRRVLRKRSRYERQNNGYCKGLIRGRTNDTCGTGPRLQLDLPEQIPDPDFAVTLTTGTPTTSASDLARQVEARWREWVEATGFNDDLRLMAEAEDGDGESFAVFATNSALPTPVQLDLRLYEAEQIATPDLDTSDPQAVDGIEFDAEGNPTFYHLLRAHPGDSNWWYTRRDEFDRIPADQVIHLFERERPGQWRGIPRIAHALNLYAILRRYKSAYLKSAELGSKVAGVIENPNAPVGAVPDEPEQFEAFDKIPFPDNVLLNLGGGQVAKSFDGKEPPAGYDEFVHSTLTEAGMGATVARNRATGSSAEYNYSSARLDHLPGQRDIRIRRERFERVVLDPTFRAWLAEALLVPDYLPAGLPPVETWEWRWHWDTFESIDPEKDAKAVQVEKSNGHVTDAEVLARKGVNWREHYQQLALEKAERMRLGLESAPPPAAPAPAEEEPAEEEEVADDEA